MGECVRRGGGGRAARTPRDGAAVRADKDHDRPPASVPFSTENFWPQREQAASGALRYSSTSNPTVCGDKKIAVVKKCTVCPLCDGCPGRLSANFQHPQFIGL